MGKLLFNHAKIVKKFVAFVMAVQKSYNWHFWWTVHFKGEI
jgi:hypothetical protein